jgi:hypothetical protein
MSQCNFCDREFQNSQAVRAHLKKCRNYQQSKKANATRIQPITLFPPHSRSTSQGAPAPSPVTTPADLVTNLMTQMTHQFAGPDEATRLKQKREALLARLCTSLVDWYCPLEGVVTHEMAVAAKVEILDELGALVIEDLPQAELTLRGTAIRNRIFSPYLRKQQEQGALKNKRQRQDTTRSQLEANIRARHTTRKTVLVELGVTRALKLAASRGIPSRALVVLEWEVRARLEAWLVGDETETQVDETIEASIDRPLLEWEARIEQFQSAQRQRILDKCLTAAMPVVVAAVPWVKKVVVKKIYETLGMQPPPSSPTNEASAAAEQAATPDNSDAPTPCPVRRRRVPPTSSDEGHTETIAPDDEDTSVPPEYRTATS